MGLPAGKAALVPHTAVPPTLDERAIAEATRLVEAARRPLILAGGGARRSEAPLRQLAERLDAPVVTTANGRGLLHRHPLGIHASPSLAAVRRLIADADLVIAAGTELGPTDYDMYADGGFALPANLIRIDIDPAQIGRWPATVGIVAGCSAALGALMHRLRSRKNADGALRAATTRDASFDDIGPSMRGQVRFIEMIRDTLPGSIIVGDSTQPIYAGNLCYDHDRPGGWFNGATGFGALGYGPPAAIGAALADPAASVVCLSGDGGFQFTLPEIGAALDAKASVTFVVWNNRGYREIETSMLDAGVAPVGVSPAPPDFCRIADAYGIPAERLLSLDGLPAALLRARNQGTSCLIEIMVE